MVLRTLGPKGIAVSALGLGCWGMSHAYGRADEIESIATIQFAVECGINLFDTADVYGNGHNERLLARGLRAHLRDAMIATKCGFVGDEHGKLRVDGRPQHVRAACDASLRRLGREVIDLYFLHRLDRHIPIEDTVGAMADLVRAGKVRFLGLSEVASQTLRRAHAVHPITALQSEYSLWSRDIESDILPTCRELSIALLAFSPLGRGFLTGAVRSREALSSGDYRRGLPRFTERYLAANLTLISRLDAIASERGATPAQLALAWLLSRGPDVIPIVGTTRRCNIVENIGAASIELSCHELSQLDALAALARGPRHNPSNLRFIDS